MLAQPFDSGYFTDNHHVVTGRNHKVGVGADLELAPAVYGNHLHAETVGEFKLAQAAAELLLRCKLDDLVVFAQS